MEWEVVNFDPVDESGPIVGGGRSFASGRFFAIRRSFAIRCSFVRLWYYHMTITWFTLYNLLGCSQTDMPAVYSHISV